MPTPRGAGICSPGRRDTLTLSRYCLWLFGVIAREMSRQDRREENEGEERGSARRDDVRAGARERAATGVSRKAIATALVLCRRAARRARSTRTLVRRRAAKIWWGGILGRLSAMEGAGVAGR